MSTRGTLKCERCGKGCSTRLPDPIVLVDRPNPGGRPGRSAQFICLRCVNESRKNHGAKKKPTKAAIKKRDRELNLTFEELFDKKAAEEDNAVMFIEREIARIEATDRIEDP